MIFYYLYLHKHDPWLPRERGENLRDLCPAVGLYYRLINKKNACCDYDVAKSLF